jgi:chromosome condensin MukBEF ATPase and DNA-binding subunit MukB
MQFSIRDLLWTTLFVAMATAAWTNHLRMQDRIDRRRREHQREVAELKAEVSKLEKHSAGKPRFRFFVNCLR